MTQIICRQTQTFTGYPRMRKFYFHRYHVLVDLRFVSNRVVQSRFKEATGIRQYVQIKIVNNK